MKKLVIEMKVIMGKALTLTIIGCLLGPAALGAAFEAQDVFDLSKAASGDGWKMVNRGATAIVDGVRKAVRFDERSGNGIAWLEGSKFTEGTIEFDVRGKDVPQRSFVGIVFNGTDDETWDAVYFRPFNFNNPNPENAGHSVQYVSHPALTWQKLRAAAAGPVRKAGPSDSRSQRLVPCPRRRHRLECPRLCERRG